jgi:hypothetical protein
MRVTNPDESGSASSRGLLGAATAAQTYKNLLYLLFAFPLGLVYYITLTIGFTLGVGLSILLVGFLILLGTVIGLRFIASFERTLANTLLGTEISAPTDVRHSGDGVVESATAYLRASSTWRGLGFVVLKFPIGILSFVLLVTFLGTAVELLLLPLFPEGVFNIQVAGLSVAQNVRTTIGQTVAVPIGAVLALFAVHLLNAFAAAIASVASSLLGSGESEADESAESAQSS